MTETGFLLLWVKAFVVTLVVELCVATPLLRKTGAPLWQRCTVVGVAQLATHPLVWFVIPAFHLPRAAFLAIAELWAMLAEWIVYRATLPGAEFRRTLLASAAANAASLTVGLVLHAVGAT